MSPALESSTGATHTSPRSEARWTVAHRAFPLLTGLGVAVALMSLRWFPPPTLIAFFVLPFAFAIPLSGLSTLGMRRMRVPRLAVRHVVAALAAVATAMAFALLIGFLSAGLDLGSAMGGTEQTVGLGLLALSVGALAGWLACHLERLADRGSGLPCLGKPPWNPRRWGPAGAIGVALFLVAAIDPAWLFTWPQEARGSTPWGMAGFFAIVASIVGVVCLGVGLSVEGALGLRRSLRKV